MRVTVQAELCGATATCVQICPSVFQMGDDERVRVIIDEPTGPAAALSAEAADACPTGAIVIAV